MHSSFLFTRKSAILCCIAAIIVIIIVWNSTQYSSRDSITIIHNIYALYHMWSIGTNSFSFDWCLIRSNWCRWPSKISGRGFNNADLVLFVPIDLICTTCTLLIPNRSLHFFLCLHESSASFFLVALCTTSHISLFHMMPVMQHSHRRTPSILHKASRMKKKSYGKTSTGPTTNEKTKAEKYPMCTRKATSEVVLTKTRAIKTL